jgi:hypothetical protein
LADYDTFSETAEVLVNDEGLAIPSLLKVQSTPLGDLRDSINVVETKIK